MKKFVVFLLVCVLCAWPKGSAFAVIYGRGGYESQGYSESTAWEIDSAEVLAKLRDDVNAGNLQYAFYVKLTKDIDLTSQIYRAWEPIGRNPFAADLNFNPNDERGVFRGHFDGNGHTIKVEISKLCEKSGYYDIVPIFHGLFGIIMGGSIKNLNVSGNIEIFMRESLTPVLVGGIASYLASGSIENCRFNGSIKAENLVGSFRSDGGTQAGGIVARAGYSFYIFSIKNCRVGSCSDTVITASDALETENTYAGGIAAYLDDNTYQSKSSTVSGNYIRAEINGKYSGGIYAARGRGTGLVYDNTEDDPSEPPPDTASVIITTASFPSGNIGDYYSETLTAATTGGTWPVTWALTSGTLPAGFTLNSDGTISGSPTAKGTYKFTVKASIGSSGIISATKEYTITIADNQPSYSLTVKNESLSSGTVNKSYAETLKAELTGAELPASWSYTGTLPPGLTLNTSGTITGTPTKAGEYTFTVKAVFGAFEGAKSFTVKITAGGDTELPEAEDDIAPEFKAHQPDLDGIIVVNFYAYMPEISGVNYNNSYVNFKILNDTSYNPTQEYDPSFTAAGKLGTYYGFRCCVTSVQMADPITATLHYGNGLTVEHTYKLTDYLDKYYYASATPELLRNVVGAMKDYGHYAQIALAEVNGWEIGKDHLETNAANVYTASDIEEARQAVEDYAKSWNVGNSGIKSIGYRLALDADTIIELFIRPNDDYNGNVSAYSRGVIGITDTSANIAVKQSDGRYLVQISGIPAHRLDYTNVIRVVTDKGEFDVKVSALSYVNTILNSEKYNDNMKKAVTSLYKYHKAAKEYWENNNQ